MIATIWFWTVWVIVAAGITLLMAAPGVWLRGLGHAALPATVHLFTLGAILGGYYPLQAAVWRNCYGANRFASILNWPIWLVHTAGALLMVWGLSFSDGVLAYAGGHYLVPTAVVMFWMQGMAWLLRRDSVTPRQLEIHLPALGLAVVMPLGVMLLMDRETGQYGFYGGTSILLHVLAAGFLFVLPAQQMGYEGWGNRRESLTQAAISGLGLMAVALSGVGFDGGLPMGLGLLGAVALWAGLPLGGEMNRGLNLMRRLPWAVVGLILLYIALLLLRGRTAGEVFPLGALAATVFLFAAVLPDWLYRLTLLPADSGGLPADGREAQPHGKFAFVIYGLQLSGATIIVVAQMVQAEAMVRAGATVWLISLAVLALRKTEFR
ncbi:MAG: hypothetical protein IID61_00305 [SAR324 cluster bacterium]|nr:hypothetical protein [SAR324 cluster bacterium]